MEDVMLDLKAIGNRIRRHRKLHNLSQEAFATEIGISTRYLRSIEHGECLAKMDIYMRIKLFFHISLDYLITGSDIIDDDTADIFALIEHCPPKQKPYLTQIISSYVESLSAE